MKDARERTALLDQASSPEIESTVLGAMLLFPHALSDGCDRLHADDFALDSNQRIFCAIANVRRKGHGVDHQTVIDDLRSRSELDSVGGLAYLLRITEGVPRNFDISTYVVVLRDKARLRRSLAVFYDGYNAGAIENTQAFLDGNIRELQMIAEQDTAIDIPSVGEWMHTETRGYPETILDTVQDAGGIRTGFSELDELTGGFQPGELIVVAARPSMGKTAWACNVSSYIALHDGQRAALFSIEQRRKAMVRRMLAGLARVDARDIRRGDVRMVDKQALLDQRQRLGEAALFIDHTPGITSTRIRAKCARLKRTRGLDIVLVDQLSHVAMSDCREREFRLRVGEQTKMHKRLAEELGIPVVVFNQLRRHDGKGDATPTLSDLKESGNIEEDADVVILLHRADYYDKTDESLRGKGQQIIAKNREGETATVHCTYNGRILRWEDTRDPAATQNSF